MFDYQRLFLDDPPIQLGLTSMGNMTSNRCRVAVLPLPGIGRWLSHGSQRGGQSHSALQDSGRKWAQSVKPFPKYPQNHHFFMGGLNHPPNGRCMIGFPTLATFFALLSWSTVTFLDIFFYQLRTRLLQKETPAIVNHSQ
jgi:hypothetical protein